MRHQTLIVLAGVAAIVLGSTGAGAAPVQFAINYSGDAANVGFRDPVLGPARKAAFEAAANQWGNLLVAAYPGETVHVRAHFEDLGDGLLAEGLDGGALAANFTSTHPKYLPSTYYHAALGQHLHGSDVNGIFAEEIDVAFNTRVDAGAAAGTSRFYAGLDGAPGTGQYDMWTISLHEIAHGLGILSLLDQTGHERSESTPDVFDRFLYRGSTRQKLLPETSQQRLADLKSGDLYFDSPEAGPIKLYAPPTFLQGTTGIHVDPGAYPTDFMVPSYLAPHHDFSVPMLAMLNDIGWDLAVPVPEPSAGFTSMLCVTVTWTYRRWRRR